MHLIFRRKKRMVICGLQQPVSLVQRNVKRFPKVPLDKAALFEVRYK